MTHMRLSHWNTGIEVYLGISLVDAYTQLATCLFQLLLSFGCLAK